MFLTHLHIDWGLFDPIHLFLAYSGMLVHTIIQTQKSINQYKKEWDWRVYVKMNIMHWLADIIAIPVILIIFTDPAMKELWPMNYITATFTGYTAQSMLHSLFKLKKK